MPHSVSDLPDDPKLLKELLWKQMQEHQVTVVSLQQAHQVAVVSLQQEYQETVANLTKERNETVERLQNELKAAKQKLFGSSSERSKIHVSQQELLFNEAEKIVAEEKKAITEGSTKIKGHKRRKRTKTKIIPDNVEEVHVICDIDESQKICACGCKLTCFGEDIHKVLEVEKPKFKAIVYHKNKYVCKSCNGTSDSESPDAITAKTDQFLTGTKAGNFLLAWILAMKFQFALPFYRLSSMIKTFGVEISRGVMAHWAISAAEKLLPLYEQLHLEVLSAYCILMDETTLQVLKEPGRKAQNKSYMWVMRGERAGPAILYHYAPSRSGKVAENLLRNFGGTLVSDGYSAYDKLAKSKSIKHANCHAHCRRYFFDSFKNENSKSAKWFIDQYARLYRLESVARRLKFNADSIAKIRKEKSKPILDEMFTKCVEIKNSAYSGTMLGKAITYMLKFKIGLSLFLEDGNIPIDNNRIENDIRPFVIGRKNWLFSDTQNGAQASAIIYSLTETAKANGWVPEDWFYMVFSQFRFADTEEKLRQLLPMYAKPV